MVMPQNDFNRIFHSFFDGYGANMTSYPPKRNFRNIAKIGTIFQAVLDFDDETFEITESSGHVKLFYDRIRDIKLNQETWKFYMYFKGSHRIRILT